MVRAQMLSELEEIIAYKQYADQPERQQTMRKTWMKRFVRYSNNNSLDAYSSIKDFRVVSQTWKYGSVSCKFAHWF